MKFQQKNSARKDLCVQHEPMELYLDKVKTDMPPSKDLPALPDEALPTEFNTDINIQSKNADEKVNNDAKMSTNDETYSYARVDFSPMSIDEYSTCDEYSNANNDHSPVGHTLINDQLYAVVDKANTNTQTEQSTDIQNIYDFVAHDPMSSDNDTADLYAPIDWSQKRRKSAEDVLTPEYVSRARIDRRVSDGMINTPFFNDGQNKIPPQMPKPYASKVVDFFLIYLFYAILILYCYFKETRGSVIFMLN